jgi:hypothetical protein
MRTLTIIQDLQASSAKLPALIEAHAICLGDLQKRMVQLSEAGLIYAAPHWREGKYLYLVHPVTNGGKRKREYIGTDQTKIEEAKAALERARQYDALEAKSRELARQLSEGLRYLQDAVGHLSDKKKW